LFFNFYKIDSKEIMMKRTIDRIARVAILVILFSCGSTTEVKDGEDKTTNKIPVAFDSVSNVTESKYDFLISNIPIPFDILNKLYNAGVAYNEELTNLTNNVTRYSKSNAKALNLGVYGADLTYLITFEQFNDMSMYLKTSKKLADELSIPLAFDKEALEKYDSYRQNKDSLEKMLYKSYNEVDKTLKSNQRIGMATMVVTGGWVEGLYLCTKTLNNAPAEGKNKLLYRIIWQQHIYLDNIMELLNEFKDDKDFTWLITDLTEIKTIYDNLSNKGEVNQAEVAVISSKIELLRNKIIL